MSANVPAWVRDRALPAGDAPSIRRAIVEDVMAVASSQLGLYYGVAVVNGELHWTDVDPIGSEERTVFLTQCRGRPLREFVDLNVSHLTTVNEFGETFVEDLRDNKMYDTMLDPMGALSVVAMTAMVSGVQLRPDPSA